MTYQSLQSLESTHREYAIWTLMDEAEKAGLLFAPELTPLQMQYRTEIFLMMKQAGWTLTHWAVAGQYPLILGYPVFEKQANA